MDTNDISSSGFVFQDCHSETMSSFYDIKEIETKGYSSLHTATYLGKKVILKGLKPEFKNERFYQDLIKKEFEISRSLDHPNIVKTIDFQNIPNLGDCIVMEYIEGQTLTQTLTQTKGFYDKIFNELLDAMEYFHSKQIIHRDLKPSNILITNNGNNVKIIDFGLSDTDDYVILKQAAGTRKYAAPEQMTPNNIIDCRADIYSLGIILKNNFPKSYQKIADKCAQQDREKRFSSVDEIRNHIKKKKITKISVVISTILILLFALSFVITKHYISGKTYNINEKEILAEATQYIDTQIAAIKIKIEEGPVSDVDEFNATVETYQNLISTDYKKWAEQIPSDTPFYNDFITSWNSYLSEKIKDIFTSYTDWYRESFQLIFDNLKPGEEIVTDPDMSVKFKIIRND
ncbi:MAG: serine/threonine protein kinase [Bacteroidales bacterium]|nr:serine/threonine protein kinase [Bacteroidales bacterium]